MSVVFDGVLYMVYINIYFLLLEKVLLMLQSIKRAYKLDSNHPKLHSCLIRFYEFINQSKDCWDPAVEEVVRKEVKVLLKDKDAKQLNKEFLERHSKSLEHVLEGAKMMYYLDPKNQSDALNLVINFDNNYCDINIQVSFEYNGTAKTKSLFVCLCFRIVQMF